MKERTEGGEVWAEGRSKGLRKVEGGGLGGWGAVAAGPLALREKGLLKQISGTSGNSAYSFPQPGSGGGRLLSPPAAVLADCSRCSRQGEQSPEDGEAAVGASWALGWGGGDVSWRSSVRVCMRIYRPDSGRSTQAFSLPL